MNPNTLLVVGAAVGLFMFYMNRKKSAPAAPAAPSAPATSTQSSTVTLQTGQQVNVPSQDEVQLAIAQAKAGDSSFMNSLLTDPNSSITPDQRAQLTQTMQPNTQQQAGTYIDLGQTKILSDTSIYGIGKLYGVEPYDRAKVETYQTPTPWTTPWLAEAVARAGMYDKSIWLHWAYWTKHWMSFYWNRWHSNYWTYGEGGNADSYWAKTVEVLKIAGLTDNEIGSTWLLNGVR